jgi:hypothetical protein
LGWVRDVDPSTSTIGSGNEFIPLGRVIERDPDRNALC